MSAAATTTAASPEAGQLAETPLPRLLVDLARRRYDGVLQVDAPGTKLRIALRGGAPIEAEREGTESLCDYLVRRGTLSPAQGAKANGLVAAKRCLETKALLALQLITPKDLLVALRERLHETIVVALSLESGRFELAAGGEGQPASDALRIDPLPAVHAALIAHWRPDRMLADLQQRLAQYPLPAASFEGVAAGLPQGAGVGELLAGVDGSCDAWSLLVSATAVEKIAALWVLEAAQALDWRDGPPAQDSPEAAEEAQPELESEIEIEIAGGGRAAEATSAAAPSAETSAGGTVDEDAAAEMRTELLERHARMGDEDLYAVLGLDRTASLGQIKRAYLKAAKRLHPDALTRLALDDVKVEANEVFARITRAHETLSDEDQRANYDANLDGHAEGDAGMLAQAELLFVKGEVMMKAGQFNQAVEYLEASAELWPEECAYQSALGWTLFKKTPPEDARAREHLEKALALDDGDASTHMRLSVVLKALGEVEKAAEHVRRAKEIDPQARV